MFATCNIFIFSIAIARIDAQGAFNMVGPMLPPLKMLQGLAELDKIGPVLISAACQGKLLESCQRLFNLKMNATSYADWTNYEVLQLLIDSWLEKGLDNGFLPLCKARSSFYQCLGASYDSCINRFHFLNNGFSLEASSAYVKIFKELEFICNGGILQSLRKWDCILENKAALKNFYDLCLAAYTQAISGDPSTMCTAAEDFMLCARLPYSSICGQDVGWWECERIRVSLDFDNHCPQLTCSYKYYPVHSDPNSLETIPAVRNKRELFRAMNPQFMSTQKMALFVGLGARADERLKRKKRSALRSDVLLE